MQVHDDPYAGLTEPGTWSPYTTLPSHAALPYANVVPYLTRSGSCPGTVDK